jgi:hypothetical protein
MRSGDGAPIIDLDWARKATTDQIISKFEERREWDHASPVAIAGNNHPTNLQPLTIEEHAVKTKSDVANIAKAKRLEIKQAEFRRRILAKTEPTQPDRLRPSKPLPGSRTSGWKRRMNGKWERRG